MGFDRLYCAYRTLLDEGSTPVSISWHNYVGSKFQIEIAAAVEKLYGMGRLYSMVQYFLYFLDNTC